MKSTRKPVDTDHCRACGSESLFSVEVGNDDLAVERGGRYATFCNDCGHDQDRPVKRRRKTP